MTELKQVHVPDIGGHGGVPVIEVLVKLGDSVRKDQGLVTLESDKATMEVPTPFAGIVRELKLKIGDEVGEGALVAIIEVTDSAVENSTPSAAPSAPAIASAPKTVESEQRNVAHTPQPSQSVIIAPATTRSPPVTFDADELLPGKVPYASPAVRVFARELGVDLARLQGSARGGRITKEDVQAFVKASLSGGVGGVGNIMSATNVGGGLNLLPWPQVDFEKFGSIEVQALSRIKKISGANLARNWAMIPHVTQFDEADITEMELFRKKLNEEHKDLKVTPLVFLIKAVVAALKRYPQFNASLDGDNLVLKKYFHIGIAVDTPDGLVVPVIRDCESKGLVQLSMELAEISAKAREKKLTPLDMQGGCFSISSLGGIGGTAFTPIINAPEVAILGVSRSQTKPVWTGLEFAPRLLLPLSLSYDHRVIDGAAAARFTAFLAQTLSDVRRLLI